MTAEEFRKNILKVNSPRHHTIVNSLGIRQMFSYVQKNKWFDIGRPLKEAQFQKIVRKVNDLLANELMNGNDIKFPCRMGVLELRKFQSAFRYKNGKITVNNPIDWDATLELWYKDREAYLNKTIVKTTDRNIFQIIYNKSQANYNNKSFIEFKVNRDIKQILKKHIKQGRIDAFEG